MVLKFECVSDDLFAGASTCVPLGRLAVPLSSKTVIRTVSQHPHIAIKSRRLLGEIAAEIDAAATGSCRNGLIYKRDVLPQVF
jgi:hypothetical protein